MKTSAWILALLGFSMGAECATVTFSWDLNPPEEKVTSYTLYERTQDAETYTYTPITQTNQPPAVVSGIPFGEHTYALKARNAWGESLFSNHITIEFLEDGTTIPAGPPTIPNLQINQVTPTDTVSFNIPIPKDQFYVDYAYDLQGPWNPFIFVSLLGEWKPKTFQFETTTLAPAQFWEIREDKAF